MIITCDAVAEMGYIYLREPKAGSRVFNTIEKYNTILRYVNNEDLEIPIINDVENQSKFKKHIDMLEFSSIEYNDFLRNGYIEDWKNDKNEVGYITGIEFSYKKDAFINDIKKRMYKIILVEFDNQGFSLITFDSEKKVFNPSNIIFPAGSKKDAYYIVEIKRNILFIKGLIFKENRTYKLEYLRFPQFVLVDK